MTSSRSFAITIIGAGKVGRALRRGLVAAGAKVRLVPYRGLPASLSDPSVVVCAVRDGQLRALAEQIAPRLAPGVCVLHCAGALGPEVLLPLVQSGHSVAVMHPLVSFATAEAQLKGRALVVWGDRRAGLQGARLGRLLGMKVVRVDRLDPAPYHAAAAMVANGTVAVVHAAGRLLEAAGLESAQSGQLLGPLLGSVASNLTHVGSQLALTGPVRRGDQDTLKRHLVAAKKAGILGLYTELVRAQLALVSDLAAALPGDALDRAGLVAIQAMVTSKKRR